jgi:DNA invertase Pin-like site-specific DNA recombinase
MLNQSAHHCQTLMWCGKLTFMEIRKKKDLTMCHAISYRRWSHPSQTEGDSNRRQTEAVQTFCRTHNLTLDDTTYIDAGVSAWSGKNADEGALSAILEAVKNGTIKPGTVLCVEQLDRLTRLDLDQALALFGKILRAGISIGHIRKGRILTKADLRGFGITEFAIELILGAEESNKKSERVSQSLGARKREAATGKIWTSKGPAWLRLVGEKWEVIEEEAAKVRLIYSLCISGFGIEATCKKLVKDGISPMGKSTRWTRNYIRSILREKIALGYYQPTQGKDRQPVGSPIANYYTPIISEETYYKAQTSLDSRIRHCGPVSKFINILGGLVVDGSSGSTMFLASKPQRDGSVKKSLYPSAAINQGAKYWSLPMEGFEDAILTSINELQADQETSPEEEKLAGLVAKKESLETKITKIQSAIADNPDFDSALTVLKNLEATIKALASDIEAIEAKLAIKPADALEATKKAILAGDRLVIRQKVRNVIEKITVYKRADHLDVTISYKVASVRTLKITREAITNNKYSASRK